MQYNEQEIWKEVPGFSNYEVSSIGNVRKKIDQKLIKQQLAFNDVRSYLACTLIDKHGKLCKRFVHTIVALAFLGKKPRSKQAIIVNHKNGYKHDNRVSNLEYITQRENVKHAFKLGLNTTSIPVEVLDNTTGEVHHFHSVTELAKFLKLQDKSVYALLGRHKTLLYKDKYTFKFNEEKLPLLRRQWKTIHFYDCISGVWKDTPGVNSAAILTGVHVNTIRSNMRNNSKEKSQKVMIHGYYFFDDVVEKRLPIFSQEEAIKSREKLYESAGGKF